MINMKKKNNEIIVFKVDHLDLSGTYIYLDIIKSLFISYTAQSQL